MNETINVRWPLDPDVQRARRAAALRARQQDRAATQRPCPDGVRLAGTHPTVCIHLDRREDHLA